MKIVAGVGTDGSADARAKVGLEESFSSEACGVGRWFVLVNGAGW